MVLTQRRAFLLVNLTVHDVRHVVVHQLFVHDVRYVAAHQDRFGFVPIVGLGMPPGKLTLER